MKHAILPALLALGLASLSAQAAIVLKLGYETPRTDSQHLAAEKFNELVKEKTQGSIELSLFPDSALGNAQALISSVRAGTLDMEMSSSSNFTGLSSKLNVLDIPFMFKSKEHAYAVLDGEIGDTLAKELESQGLKVIGWWEVGFRTLTNSRAPVKTPDDIKGLKIRTNQNPMYIKAFELLGANPVPMPVAELYTALETQTVDAQEHPISVLYSFKFNEVQKYLTITNHGYTPLLLVMNKAKFESLSEAEQQALLAAAKETAAWQRALIAEREGEMIAEMEKAGLEVLRDVDIEPFRAVIGDQVRQMYIEQNGDELPKAIDALAK